VFSCPHADRVLQLHRPAEEHTACIVATAAPVFVVSPRCSLLRWHADHVLQLHSAAEEHTACTIAHLHLQCLLRFQYIWLLCMLADRVLQPRSPAEEHTVKVVPAQQQPAAKGTDQVSSYQGGRGIKGCNSSEGCIGREGGGIKMTAHRQRPTSSLAAAEAVVAMPWCLAVLCTRLILQ
jgi:hypothetical protein